MKKVLHCDLHVHSNYSYDNASFNTMEQNVTVAIQRGIDVLCFTDHIECGKLNTFDSFPFEARKQELDALSKKYDGQIKLLLGFEMESPHHHPEQLAFLRSLNPDMIIGSVHFPCEYNGIDYKLSHNEYARLYDKEVRKMVEFGGFDVLGHVDMPKKYQPYYKADKPFVFETLKICAQKGIVPEMNTSSLRTRPDCNLNGETMASVEAIGYYASCGGKHVVINSDSHGAEALGYAFWETYEQVQDIVKLCYFEKGKLVQID